MRISDWSSDVCSSDLSRPPVETPLLLVEIGSKDAGRTPHLAFLGAIADTGRPFEDMIDVIEKSRSVSGTSRCLIEDVDRRHSATALAVPSCHGKIGQGSWREHVCR